MPTKVVQIDLDRPLEPITGLRGYSHIWALVRRGRRPLGWIKCPRSMVGEALLPETISHLVCAQLGHQVWESMLTPLATSTYAPQISVVICTREHPDQLRRQLASLAALQYTDYEVIVVDNAPRSDATRRVCERLDFVHYLMEPRPGLDFARNAGWRAARHEIVAYTDDDAVVDPHWLTALGAAYENPGVWCVTGLTLPLELETQAQECFEQYGGFARGFRRRIWKPGRWHMWFPLGAGVFGSGVNMSIRRSALQRIHGFDEALDTGSLTRGGGDLDIYVRVLKAGGMLVYEPCALAWHEHRRRMTQFERQMFDYGYGFYAFLTKYERHDLELSNHARALKRRWWRHWGVHRLWLNARKLVKGRPYFPLNLILREMFGFVLGPPAYERSLKRMRKIIAASESNANLQTLGSGMQGVR